ncbi:MAG TPA: hypothetical protein VKV15_15200 [Bryobacteraceae bacterium]|nr:hypothetical protein [Bryobacteraceae bacterium]
MLREAGRSDCCGVARHGIRGALVVAQVAISAGLFVRSLERAEHMYLGFDPNNVLTVNLDPHQIGYDEARTKAFYRELEDRGARAARCHIRQPRLQCADGLSE